LLVRAQTDDFLGEFKSSSRRYVIPTGTLAERASLGKGATMSGSEPDTALGPFSSSGAQATPWASALAILGVTEVFWLSTVRPDGRPHVTPLLAAWSLHGKCFTTGGQERKALNLERNPLCVLTTGTNALTAVDVVIAGGVSLYRVAPTVGFAFGKLPTSSQTRYTWPNR
jgi:hypothetical protein